LNPTCSKCADGPAYYSVRISGRFERTADVYCERCAVPFVDRGDAQFLVLSLYQEAGIDAIRAQHPAFSEVDLLQWFFLAQCMWAAEQAMPVTLRRGPVRASDLLQIAIETAHCSLGPCAPDFLRQLGFTSSRALGEILYRFVAAGLFLTHEGDRLEDFTPSAFDEYVRENA
jgi:uncharacterized repeat protein (TIGR04138 family)